MAEKGKRFTDRHRQVLGFIATGMDGLDAWKKVYPRSSRPTAKSAASRLRKRPEARRYLRELAKQREEALEANQRVIIRKLTEIMLGKTRHVVVTKDGKIEVYDTKDSDMIAAADKLAKILGIYAPEKNKSGPVIDPEVVALMNSIRSGK